MSYLLRSVFKPDIYPPAGFPSINRARYCRCALTTGHRRCPSTMDRYKSWILCADWHKQKHRDGTPFRLCYLYDADGHSGYYLTCGQVASVVNYHRSPCYRCRRYRLYCRLCYAFDEALGICSNVLCE